jgi:tetratricopeptide (TPR) repeat protein
MTPAPSRQPPDGRPWLRAAGLATTAAALLLVGWLFSAQPASVVEITGGVAHTVGAYRIDTAQFEEGRELFAREAYEAARAAFERADPARLDARTQFYIAYTYYREGWGRLSHDDVLYAKGLAALERATAVAPDGRVVVDDPSLGIQSADELRVELRRGMTREWDDLNPLRIFRSRK